MKKLFASLVIALALSGTAQAMELDELPDGGARIIETDEIPDGG